MYPPPFRPPPQSGTVEPAPLWPPLLCGIYFPSQPWTPEQARTSTIPSDYTHAVMVSRFVSPCHVVLRLSARGLAYVPSFASDPARHLIYTQSIAQLTHPPLATYPGYSLSTPSLRRLLDLRRRQNEQGIDKHAPLPLPTFAMLSPQDVSASLFHCCCC